MPAKVPKSVEMQDLHRYNWEEFTLWELSYSNPFRLAVDFGNLTSRGLL